jgi:threonine dehydrogenase-like Zn-dependent dehydrogenase
MVGPRKIEIREFNKPQLNPRDILMKVRLCGICGSDIHMWNGRLVHLEEPFIPGHEVVGEVYEAGNEALDFRKLRVGDQIVPEILIPCGHCFWCRRGQYCLCLEDDRSINPTYGRQFGCNIPLSRPPSLWGGFAQYLYVPENAIVHKFEKRVSWKSAVLTEPLATAIHAIHLSKLKVGQSCLIIGPGPIGLMLVVAAKEAGAHPIILVGTKGDEYRLEMGSKLGADFTINTTETQNLMQEVKYMTGELGVDVAIEAAGSPKAQILAIRSVRKGGTCVFLGLSGKKDLTLIPDTDIVFKEITLVGCLMSAHGFEGAVKIIESGRFPLESLVTAEFPLNKIQEAFEYSEAKRESSIKTVVNPWT